MHPQQRGEYCYVPVEFRSVYEGGAISRRRCLFPRSDVRPIKQYDEVLVVRSTIRKSVRYLKDVEPWLRTRSAHQHAPSDGNAVLDERMQ